MQKAFGSVSLSTGDHHYVFVGSSQDWHALDWFGVLYSLHSFRKTTFLSDRPVESSQALTREIPLAVFYKAYTARYGGNKKSLLKTLAPYLERGASLIRLMYQVRSINKNSGSTIFHAYSMSYSLICALAGVRFIAMPQGSDLLVRPEGNKILGVLTKYTLARAWVVAVASPSLAHKATLYGAVNLVEVQNGISTKETAQARTAQMVRDRVTSMRSMRPNYRLHAILNARNQTTPEVCLTFTFPDFEPAHKKILTKQFASCDEVLGRVSQKQELFKIYAQSLACLSIPSSDASPRSVYEAIFCGAIVITVASSWVDNLPDSMKRRLVVVDLERKDWLKSGLEQARVISETSAFSPCCEAIERYSDVAAIRHFLGQLFPPVDAV